MLKQTFFIVLLVTSIFSIGCKKQYSCQCSTTIEKPGYYPYSSTKIEPLDKRTTKKRAEEICSHTEKQLHKNTDDYTGPDETLTTSCAVK